MSTEYRRGIPSNAHVEAATRLGLLWLGSDTWLHRFRSQNGQIEVWYFEDPNETPDWRSPDFAIGDLDYRPIRPDGTPVDWEVLDQEVARVGQQGQPQGFRADLWRRICRHFSFVSYDGGEVASLSELSDIDDVGIHSRHWQWGWGTADLEAPTRQQRADILARWTVYQELKPLYDLVDGAQGEAAMPRDVEAEWSVCSGGSDTASGNWRLCRNGEGLYAQGVCAGLGGETAYVRWHPSEGDYGVPLRNFAAVLDAVAEARVRARQTPANPDAILRTVAQPPALPEPRRFADVRPDRHGWRWWRVYGYGEDGARIECRNDNHFRWFGRGWVPWPLQSFVWPDRTVIPTDEQGNPVSWNSIGPTDPTEMRYRQALAAEGLTPGMPSVPAGTAQTVTVQNREAEQVPGIYVTVGTNAKPTQNEAITTMPLPRFTADELDDVDHSRTTKLDEVTLRRGKLPTVEQIAKYREVRARRTGGAVADALKESRIDCEVAQYVLERWAGGLGDVEAKILVEKVWRMLIFETKAIDTFVEVENAITQTTLDTTEPPDTAAQQTRQQAEEQRQRLAQVQAQIAAERAAVQPQDEAEPSRFDLIEPDPQADPAASIRAWEARQAAAKVRPIPAPPRIAKPAAAPRRPAIEVVNAEVDGLSRVDVVTVLVGRAFNGGC